MSIEGIAGFIRDHDLVWVLQNCWFSLSRVMVGVGVKSGVAVGRLFLGMPRSTIYEKIKRYGL